MRKIFFVIIVAIFAVSCSPAAKYFRTLTDGETAAIKEAKKVWGQKTDAYRILILTDSGNMVVRLYNQTPLHRDNFAAKVQAGFYDSLLFHRIIKNFMIQGGDPQSKHATASKMLGNGEAPGAKIPAEIRTDSGLYHKKGVLAAARDGNAAKASSNCQFYIAQGKIYTPAELEAAARSRGYSLTPAQQALYTTVGGIPHLDNSYTVFGELESGLAVLDKIAAAKTAPGDRPLADIRMKMFVVSQLKK